MIRSVRPVAALLVVGAVALSGCGADDAEQVSDGATPIVFEPVTDPDTGAIIDPDPGRVGPQGRVAQFVVHCEPGQVSFDDPIVLPNEPGASHQHQFFGNLDVTASPDYDSVVGADTTCEQRLDTASYWAPTLLDAAGRRVDPIDLTVYYRTPVGVDPAVVEPFPEGFMMVGGAGPGHDHGDDVGDPKPAPLEVVAWSCGTGTRRDPTPPVCSPDSTLRLLVVFPSCWDGMRLTSGGRNGHVASPDPLAGCVDPYPVAIPEVTMAIDYPSVDPDGLTLSSGPLATAHADFWNVWDQSKLETEVANCINRDLVCGLG